MLIILDRDGVINIESDSFIKSPDEWIPIPGSLEAIAKLKTAGFTVAVATNQSGIARNLFTEKMLHEIHHKMNHLLSQMNAQIDLIAYCPHHPDEGCNCRKPAPGLLIDLANYFHTNIKEAIFIGDSLRDIEAAQSAGAKPILVLTGRGKKTLEKLGSTTLLVFSNLSEAVSDILNMARNTGKD